MNINDNRIHCLNPETWDTDFYTRTVTDETTAINLNTLC